MRDVKPQHGAAYIEGLSVPKPERAARLSKPAALQMLLNWLVIGHVMNVNPAHAVRCVAQDSANFALRFRLSACASAICWGVILAATASRADEYVLWSSPVETEAAKSIHMCACT